ncbi:hypothetical protein KKG83_07940 [Candidatus Micrarchaeota archaeon]|nr:hypothetical protein [Candidatus Micrarchaeota archaeon]
MKAIPEEIIKKSAEKIVKRYKISRKEAENFFLEEALKNRKFAENALEFFEKKNFEKWKEYKKVMKKTKKSIYYYLRQYKQESPEKIQEKFDELKEKLKKEKKLKKTLSIHKELLKMHISSKERILFYEKFYQKIFKATGRPESVLDVSCGFNYFSVPFMKFKGFYAGTEHKKEFVNRVNEYFSLIQKYSEIKGKGFLLDLKNTDFDSRNELLELNKGKLFDVALVLKLIPVMEREKKGLTENLIELIPAKWLVLSCSKESMTKKEDISFRETFLINKFIKENSLYLSARLDFDNEIVFVVKRE